MRGTRAVASAVLLIVVSSAAWPQATTSSSSTATSSSTVSALPEPYTDGEFPTWARGLRRFEIISFGAFPLLLFYTRFVCDIQRFVDNGFDTTYAPWPFQNENSYTPTDDEQIQSVLTAAGLSLIFGAIDAIILYRIKLE